jgi:diamine N-acetyltransferase
VPCDPTIVPVSPEPRPVRVCRAKSGLAFEVRDFDASEREALERFYREFEPKRGAQGLPPIGDDRIARWLTDVLGQGIHLLACHQGELIGHALLVPAGPAGTVEYAVFLREDMRGHGVGTALNRAAIDAAREAGLQRIWLSVTPHNRAAIRSYEKVGFRFLPGTIYSPEAEMELRL